MKQINTNKRFASLLTSLISFVSFFLLFLSTVALCYLPAPTFAIFDSAAVSFNDGGTWNVEHGTSECAPNSAVDTRDAID